MVKKNEVRRLFETGAVKGYLPSDMSALEIRINNMVVSIHETFLNPIVPLDEQGDYSGSLYEKLMGAGYGISNVKEKISASLMNQKQKELFEIKGDEAMINRQRRGFCHDFPVEFTNSMYLSQGYELIIDLCE